MFPLLQDISVLCAREVVELQVLKPQVMAAFVSKPMMFPCFFDFEHFSSFLTSWFLFPWALLGEKRMVCCSSWWWWWWWWWASTPGLKWSNELELFVPRHIIGQNYCSLAQDARTSLASRRKSVPQKWKHSQQVMSRIYKQVEQVYSKLWIDILQQDKLQYVSKTVTIIQGHSFLGIANPHDITSMFSFCRWATWGEKPPSCFTSLIYPPPPRPGCWLVTTRDDFHYTFS